MANSNSIKPSGLPGPVDKAPDFGSEGCRFDSCHGENDNDSYDNDNDDND